MTENPFSDLDEENVASVEKMLYPAFKRQYTAFRRADIPRKLVSLAVAELPNNSVLHMMDRLLDKEASSIVPDVKNPLIANEQFIVYMAHQMTIPEGDALFAVNDRYRWAPGMFQQEARRFFTQHKDIRWMTTPKATLGRPNVLSVFNYNPLFRAYMTGRMLPLRRFMLTFSAILQNIVDIDDSVEGKMHHIYVPMSADTYTKIQVDYALPKFTLATIRKWDDPSFFFLLQLIGYLRDAETSILTKLSKGTLDRTHVILACGDDAIIYNLGEIKAYMERTPLFYIDILKHINLMKLKASNALSKNDVEVVPDDEIDRLTEIHAGAATDDAGNVKTASSDGGADNSADVEQGDSEQPAAELRPEEKVQAEPIKVSTKDPAPETQPVSDETPYDESVGAHRSRIADEVEHAIETSETPLTATQKARARQVSSRMDQIELDGQTLSELLSPAAEDPNVHQFDADMLESQIPDTSMTRSSVSRFDRVYIEQQMNRDIAAVLSSFTPHGMIINDISTADDVSEFNRVRTYTVNYVDVSGKRHTVKFELPIVDKDGTIVLNGIRSRMIKQQVNLPICKVSPTRVNLSSNFNKTLVERTGAQARRFDVHLTRYIGQLIADELVEVEYGHIETDKKVPYDYSCISSKYTAVRGAGYSFTFDYPHRLPLVGSKEAYQESPGSTFGHDNELYDLNGLLRASESLPVKQFPVAQLSWILKKGSLDPNRIAAADLSAPLLIWKSGDQYVVVDGEHRLTKAVADNLKTVPVRELTNVMMKANLVSKGQTAMLINAERTFGVYCGTHGRNYLFYGQDNVIRELNGNLEVIKPFTIREFFNEHFNDKVPLPRTSIEWTELRLLDRSFPTVFVLGYQFGLTAVLKELNHPYRFIPAGTRGQVGVDEIVISFADGKLVFPRYPLETGLILGGLDRFNMKNYVIASMDGPDAYYTLLSENRMSTNYLKGISDFFKFFVDPVTRDVLLRMGEPTTPKGLIIRATQMLSTMEHIPASSMQNFRMRGYERFADILYNNLARTLANQNLARTGGKRTFSINPKQVIMAIVQDPTVQPVEEINPIHDIKSNNMVTYTGQGGRTSRSMVVADRTFADDAVGVLSEATPDSSKVAINAYLSADPVIDNVRGMYKKVDKSDLKPANVLSATALLMPGSMQDD